MLLPASVVTTTSTVPVPGGLVAEMLVSELTVKVAALLPAAGGRAVDPGRVGRGGDLAGWPAVAVVDRRGGEIRTRGWGNGSAGQVAKPVVGHGRHTAIAVGDRGEVTRVGGVVVCVGRGLAQRVGDAKQVAVRVVA